jgi:hypothetical protein
MEDGYVWPFNFVHREWVHANSLQLSLFVSGVFFGSSFVSFHCLSTWSAPGPHLILVLAVRTIFSRESLASSGRPWLCIFMNFRLIES